MRSVRTTSVAVSPAEHNDVRPIDCPGYPLIGQFEGLADGTRMVETDLIGIDKSEEVHQLVSPATLNFGE